MERARLVAEQHSSGKTQIAWCEEHGISTKTFRRWVLGAKGREVESNRAADWVELNGCNLTPDLSSVSNEVIEILVGAYIVRVKPGFDRVMFSDICGILAGLC
jgi:transposase-like protein